MQIGCGEEIAPARHVGDALAGVVDDDGQVIACRHVLAQDHGIAPALRVRLDQLGLAAFVELEEDSGTPAEPARRRFERALHVETQTQRARLWRCAPRSLAFASPLCRPRVERGRPRDRAGPMAAASQISERVAKQG